MGEHLTLKGTRLHRLTLLLLGLPESEEIQLYRLTGFRNCIGCSIFGLHAQCCHLNHLCFRFGGMLQIELLVKTALHEPVQTLAEHACKLLNAAVPIGVDGKITVLVLTKLGRTKIGGTTFPDMMAHEDVAVGIG